MLYAVSFSFDNECYSSRFFSDLEKALKAVAEMIRDKVEDVYVLNRENDVIFHFNRQEVRR